MYLSDYIWTFSFLKFSYNPPEAFGHPLERPYPLGGKPLILPYCAAILLDSKLLWSLYVCKYTL